MVDAAAEAEETLQEQLAKDEEFITRHEDGSLTIELEYEVEFRDEKNEPKRLSEIKIRRTKGRDWKATDKVKGDIAKTVALASSASGVSAAAFDEMDSDDFLRVIRVTGTMGKSPATGGTSSAT